MRGLKHKGQITTVDGSRAFVDSDGQGSIAIGKVCVNTARGSFARSPWRVLAIGLGWLAIGLSGGLSGGQLVIGLS